MFPIKIHIFILTHSKNIQLKTTIWNVNSQNDEKWHFQLGSKGSFELFILIYFDNFYFQKWSKWFISPNTHSKYFSTIKCYLNYNKLSF